MNAWTRREVSLRWRSFNRRGVRAQSGRERMIFCSDRAAAFRRRAVLYRWAITSPHGRAATGHHCDLWIATARDYLAEARYWLDTLREVEPDHVLHGTPSGAA